jgi:hypothetical protein
MGVGQLTWERDNYGSGTTIGPGQLTWERDNYWRGTTDMGAGQLAVKLLGINGSCSRAPSITHGFALPDR